MGGCPFGNFAATLSIAKGDERAGRFREAVCGVFRDIQESLAECLREGVRAGIVRDDIPVEELAALALAAIEGLMLMTRTQRSTDPLIRGLPVLQTLLRVD